ncbi:MFS transporter, partial [Chromobacterium violaceum]
SMSAAGTALGPSLGGALLSAWGWPAVFLALAPAGAAVFLLALRSLPADAPPAGRIRFDLAGALLLALALTAYALAMTSGRGRFGPMNLALLLASAAGVAAFVRVEMRVEAPLVRIGLLRDPALAGSLIAGALVAAVMMGTLVIGPFHLSRALGLDVVATGLAMSVGPAISALAGVPAGRLTDRFGAERICLTGLVAMLAGAACRPHRRLRAVPGIQQHPSHGRPARRPARPGVRPAQPGAQSRPGHRRLGAGRRLRRRGGRFHRRCPAGGRRLGHPRRLRRSRADHGGGHRCVATRPDERARQARRQLAMPRPRRAGRQPGRQCHHTGQPCLEKAPARLIAQ